MAALTETFPPEHYDSAARFGIDHFGDAWGLTGVELSLTVEALGRQGELPTFTEKDLVGYHFLHYGADTELTTETLDMFRENDSYLAEYARSLKEALPTLLGDETSGPVQLGRIALARSRIRDISIDASLAEVTDRLEVRGGAETGDYAGAKQFGEFLYPKDGVLLHYLGRTSCDLNQESPEGWLKKKGPYTTTVGRLAVHVDNFSVTSAPDPETGLGGDSEIYQAQSFDEGHRSALVQIARVTPGPQTLV